MKNLKKPILFSINRFRETLIEEYKNNFSFWVRYSFKYNENEVKILIKKVDLFYSNFQIPLKPFSFCFTRINNIIPGYLDDEFSRLIIEKTKEKIIKKSWLGEVFFLNKKINFDKYVSKVQNLNENSKQILKNFLPLIIQEHPEIFKYKNFLLLFEL